MRSKLTNWKQAGALLFIALLLSSCEKKEIVDNNFDNNKINLVVADNFNLSSYNAVLRKTGLDKVLQNGEGPFTVLAPSDAAFTAAGYNGPAGVLGAGNTEIARIGNYHFLDGKYELDRLPFLFNQEIRTRGGRLYATHWVKDADTVLTLNGARILSINLPASNGLIQVIDRVLEPYVHDFIGDAIAADASITLFAHAARVSGMLEIMRKGGVYTVFAPNNAAMTALGYASLEQIDLADKAELLRLIKYHIVEDRRFIYDYVLSTGPSRKAQQGMMDGNSVNITLVPDPQSPNAYSGITLRGIGNTSEIQLVGRDVLTGNGILHIINGGLRITQ